MKFYSTAMLHSLLLGQSYQNSKTLEVALLPTLVENLYYLKYTMLPTMIYCRPFRKASLYSDSVYKVIISLFKLTTVYL
jgi:hypothetical protein